MYINKLFLKEFGKFYNKEIKLDKGVNVLSGDKSAGKSTVRDFIAGMFFGIDKSRSLSANAISYDERKPKGGNGYSGKLHVTKDSSSYLMERNFQMTTDGASLTDIESGKDVRLKTKNSYRDVLFDMDKSTYMDVFSVAPSQQLGSTDKEICDRMAEQLKNLKETGCSGLNKTAVLSYLENERKRFDNQKELIKMEELEACMDELGDVDKELEDIRQARRDELDSYNMEIARLKREARQLMDEKQAEIPDEDEDRERSRIFLEVEAIDEADDIKESQKKRKEKKLTDNIFVIMGTGMLVVAIVVIAVHLVGFQKSIQQLFTICTIAFVAITIIDGLFRKGVFDGNAVPDEEEFKRTIYEMGRATESRTVRVEIDRVFQEEHDKKLDSLKFQEHDAAIKRDRYYELKEKRDAIFEKYDALETEKKAIDTAIGLINSLSDECENTFAGIDGRIGSMLKLISGDVFEEAKLDDTMHVSVKKDGHFFRAEFLGRQAVNQIYLAVRLALAEAVGTGGLPLILDDVIDGADGVSLDGVLEAISRVGAEQTIILTTDNVAGAFEGKTVTVVPL